MTEKVVGTERCCNKPKTSQSVLAQCKADYLTGSWKSTQELGERYGIHRKTLQARIAREGWEHQRVAMLAKVESKIEKSVVSVGSEYLTSAFARARKYEKIIDASLAQLATDASGTPTVEPSDLDCYTRSEQRIHALALSALRIPAAVQVDLTSKGLSVGESLVNAIEKLRNTGTAIDISDEEVARISKLEVVPDNQR